ncbi:flagellin [Archaeoglobus neptunius]|uniref:flagellin n=1 Tax=Archaeoglobus neptunius TaxID=2798580 RepID=UPI00192732A1|nr:flagellin [Archaeoglobus neptunius]
MAREVISTSILMIATVIAVTAAVMVILPAVKDLAHSYTSVSGNLNERVETDMDIIFVKVTNTSTTVNVYFWVKNTGNTKLDTDLIRMSDIFLTSNSAYLHFTPSDPGVSFAIENGDGDNYWEKGETLRFSIENINASQMPQDEYLLTFVLYNGVKATDYFSW